MTPEEKRERKYNRFGIGTIVIFSGLAVYMWAGVIIPRERNRAAEPAKQTVIDKKVKQYEQTLPYYQEYLQTKEQIIHYRDSLQRTMK